MESGVVIDGEINCRVKWGYVEQLMAEVKQKTGQMINEVQAALSSEFSVKISEAIFSGLKKQTARLP